MILTVVLTIAAVVLSVSLGWVVPTVRRRHRRMNPVPVASYRAGRKDVIPVRPERTPEPEATRATDAADTRYAPPRPLAERDLATQPMEAVVGVRAQEAVGDDRKLRRFTPDRGSLSPTLKLERSAEGTLQFLPGRLEVVEGKSLGQEIRFVKSGLGDTQSITFGRAEGPQYRHIQLAEATVSRQHAKMHFDGRSWSLSNMSKTNPVIVNGLALAAEGAVHLLRDGDRIEMGEVILRFRTR